LEKACEELKERHQKGTNELDDPDRAPTGDPYRMIQYQSNQREKERRGQAERDRQEQLEHLKETKENMHRQMMNDNDNESSTASDDEDDWLLDDDDNDPALEAIRQARMNEIKEQQKRHAENVARGHGQYRTIAQDDFLPECTGTSEWVAVHFFHDEFQRCAIMDHHLALIAPLFTTCKFLRINAEKAPFFVSKLFIKTLPTLLVFHNGKAMDRLTGFDGLAKDPNKPDEWHTGKLQEWLSHTGAIDYKVPTEEIQEEMDRLGLTPRGAIWRGGVSTYDEDE
jgi:thiol-disulfide isomerase/thioredoxin